VGRCLEIRIPNDDREDRPKFRGIPYRLIVCQDDTQIEVSRIRKYDKSPSSAHLRKPVPFPGAIFDCRLSVATKYFKQHVIWECLSRWMVGRISASAFLFQFASVFLRYVAGYGLNSGSEDVLDRLETIQSWQICMNGRLALLS